MNTARWRLRCHGKVQQVGFRYTAFYLARRMGLTGWVRNLSDGSVQMEVQGETAQIRQFLIRLKSQPHLHITSTEIEEIQPLENETRFRVAN